jgi:hypothetical protein
MTPIGSSKRSTTTGSDDQKRSIVIQREIIRRRRAGVITSPEDIVPSDNDVWIERSYRTVKGRVVRYYTSMLSNKMVLLQPPTGAALIIYEHETICHENTFIKEYIRTIPPITKELIKTMHRPHYDIAFLESLGFECHPVRRRRNIFSSFSVGAN